nr:integrase, catalytic region, zinc finger, CCHC-type, peptidase aspartic, catalytic [Tanacetum cinerariifolium]
MFTTVGYIWRPTGQTFTLVGNVCPLTRIATTAIVPLREPIPIESNTDKPVVTLVYSRKSKASKNKVLVSNLKINKSVVVQIVLWYLDFGCSKHMTGDRSQLINFVQKFLGTVKFGNDHVAKIMGYGDYKIGNVTISRVYLVEGLWHNLFSKFLGTVKFGNDHVAKIMGYGDYKIGNVMISRVYLVEGLWHNLFSQVLGIVRRCLHQDDILNGIHAVEATNDSPAVPEHTTVETPTNMSLENKAYFLAEKEAIHLILTGIGDDIYSTVDACQIAQEMWEAIERLQQGESLNIQYVKTNLFWEFKKFTSHDGETMESYYTRFYNLMNEMIRNNLTVTTMQVNVQFLQQLQPESSRFVTIVKQQHKLDEVSHHKLFDILKQYQNEVNELRAKKLAKNANPLVLVATTQAS